MNSLKHHGIKGQEWGKRNGPPYPLDYEEHTEKQKRENDPKTIGKEDEKKTRGLSDKQKKYLKIGAAIVGSALAIYGIKKLDDKYGIFKNLSNGKRITDKILKRNGSCDLSGDQVLDLWVRDRKKINGEPNATMNCGSNALSMCCNAVGIKVKSTDIEGVSFDYTKHILDPSYTTSFKVTSGTDFKSKLDNYIKNFVGNEDGSHGIMTVPFSSLYRNLTGCDGHAINFLLRNGNVDYVDMSQDGKCNIRDVSSIISDYIFEEGSEIFICNAKEALRKSKARSFGDLYLNASDGILLVNLLSQRTS